MEIYQNWNLTFILLLQYYPFTVKYQFLKFFQTVYSDLYKNINPFSKILIDLYTYNLNLSKRFVIS